MDSGEIAEKWGLHQNLIQFLGLPQKKEEWSILCLPPLMLMLVCCLSPKGSFFLPQWILLRRPRRYSSCWFSKGTRWGSRTKRPKVPTQVPFDILLWRRWYARGWWCKDAFILVYRRLRLSVKEKRPISGVHVNRSPWLLVLAYIGHKTIDRSTLKLKMVSASNG